MAQEVTHDKYVADELAGRANKEHMGESASDEANKIQDISSFKGRTTTYGHNRALNSRHADSCKSCGSEKHRSDSEKPSVITARSEQIVEADCRLKEDRVVKRVSGVNDHKEMVNQKVRSIIHT